MCIVDNNASLKRVSYAHHICIVDFMNRDFRRALEFPMKKEHDFQT